MSVNTWILVAGDPAVSSLVDLARGLGGEVTVLALGTRELADTLAGTPGVGKVLFAEAGAAPLEGYAAAVAAAVAEAAPGLVLASTRSADRALLGAVAGALRCPLVTGVSAISADGGTVRLDRSVFGGIAEHTATVSGSVAVMLDGGVPPAGGGSAPVEALDLSPSGALTVVETRPAAHAAVNLNAATKVVSAGRGVKAQSDLAMVEALAAAIGAEVACTRPLAEGLDWYGHDRYIGVSGLHLAPELYIAAGVSGQLQHMVGIRGAQTIVAINSDSEAPIVQIADYSLGGDLNELVPDLIARLA